MLCGVMKNLAIVGFLILFIGLASAHDFHYKEKYSDSVVLSRTVVTYYDNEDRHSTYDYRHGYSYRATKDYFERQGYMGHGDFRSGYRYDSGVKGYRYDYVEHMRDYEKRDCYMRPPRDRLFYIKC